MVHRKIVTRFAPSPTGHLHIGGARTALFNWAFARQHGGTFILRIEDTDQKRSTDHSTRCILEDLKWLGLDWDEGPNPNTSPLPATADVYANQVGDHGPYFQSQRLDLYKKYVDQLIEAGRAYKCFKTPDELKAERDKARAEKRAYKYNRTESISLTPEMVAQYKKEGRAHVIRFRMPDTDITVDDLVLGPVTVKAEELEDFIILKSDGFPTFHLANVVDDALMEVTHVLRAQEHLMNTPKHVALADALGFDRPQYAHMPLIFNADGSKMSKRDKAKAARTAAKEWMDKNSKNKEEFFQFLLESDHISSYTSDNKLEFEKLLEKKSDDSNIALDILEALHFSGQKVSLTEIDVRDFRTSGYLPEVILNYISLLGWSPGDNIERFDLDFLVKNFDLSRIGKSNARFDRDKLLAFNTEAIGKLSPKVFFKKLESHDTHFHKGFKKNLGQEKFEKFSAAYHERSQTLAEPFRNGQFFIQSSQLIYYKPKAVQKVLIKNDGEGFNTLQTLGPLLKACTEWTTDELETITKRYAEEHGLGMGKVAQPLRVAVSGNTVSPPIYDTLVILGKKRTLERIDNCLRRNESSAC